MLPLDDPRATDPALVGAKAANLARAAAAGLPVLPGRVLVTGGGSDTAVDALRDAFATLGGDLRPLVVRSSSTAEDLTTSSMAGHFTSVVGVRGWDDLLAAVAAVRRSARGDLATMAVLIQPHLDAVRGGVAFGIDPVSGDPARTVVAAVDGPPHGIVAGTTAGTRYVLSRYGRLRDADPEPGGRLLVRRQRRRLAALTRRVERVFGGPQDLEWAEDEDGRLWLLQSRPVTATAAPQRTSGPVLGPGPVAETFPAQLRPLEQELWVEPMRAGVVEALAITGRAPRRRLRSSPVVFAVDGWVAGDLELLGHAPPRRGWIGRLDPRGPCRSLLASWRVGRLRVVLPGLVQDLVGDTDAALHDVGRLDRLGDRDLLEVLDRTRGALVALHAHEILTGTLLADRDPGRHAELTAAALGLRALVAGRARGDDEPAIVAADPSVLALSPPRIGPAAALPDVEVPPQPTHVPRLEALGAREALRLRIRWVQELGARVAAELGGRLAPPLAAREDVALLTMAELGDVVGGAPLPDLGGRRPNPEAPPLPASFRLTAAGDVVAVPDGGDGQGAGGGRAVGTVRHEQDLASLQPGDVLVVRNLAPQLAGHLDRLGGLVAETGSVLSHLAILAREARVPTVVGVTDAGRRFPSGVTVVVDGTTGTVEQVEPAARPGLTRERGVGS